MKQANYSVYIHTNTINNKVYIGITCKDPLERWGNGKKYRHSPHFYDAIQKYGWNVFTHDVLVSGLTKEQAASWEMALIACYDSTNPEKGYNVSLGGSCGMKDLHHSEETKKRLSEIGHTKTGAANNFFGRKHTEEAKRKMSVAKLNNANTLKNAIKNGMTTREKLMKPVLQFTSNGEFVRRFESATDAGIYLTGTKESHISAVCRGRRKTAYGYIWKYEEVAK